MGSKRESLDGAAVRRSSQNSLESARSVSGSGLKPSLPPEAEATKPMESDILADMTAFQAEIDALRKAADGKGPVPSVVQLPTFFCEQLLGSLYFRYALPNRVASGTWWQ